MTPHGLYHGPVLSDREVSRDSGGVGGNGHGESLDTGTGAAFGCGSRSSRANRRPPVCACSSSEQVVEWARPYLVILDRIHQYLLPRTYVEVGVSKGTSLTLALPGTICVGIDPEPDIQFPVPPTSQIYASTSDAFFEDVDLGEALGKRPLDLAFIDGMHTFEYALRDFMNLERFAGPDSTILVHDCLPTDEVSASRERQTRRWTGDVWKMIVCLRQWRPDLSVAVADVGPSGLGVISGLDPSSSVLREHYDEIYAHFLALPYSWFEQGDPAEMLGVVPGDWAHVRALLPSHPFRDGDVAVLKGRRLLRAAPAAARHWFEGRSGRLARRFGRPAKQ